MIVIKGWDAHFETSETRKLKKLHWVRLPNQHDSLAFKTVCHHKRGAEIFAAWVLMVQVASKMENRGEIPMSPDELGIVTGFPAEIFSLAISVLESPKIGWIEQSPGNLPESPDTPGFSPAERKKDGNGKKEDAASLNEREQEMKALFNEARIAYPGAKRGLETEWAHFLKKHSKRKAEIIPLLLPACKAYRAHCAREKTEQRYIKHFQGWITEERWTEEYPTAPPAQSFEEKQRNYFADPRSPHI